MAATLVGATTARTDHPLIVIAALTAIWAIVLVDLSWIWGALMIVLALRDIFYAQTRFVILISRRDNPTLFWLVVGSWLAMGALWLARF